MRSKIGNAALALCAVIGLIWGVVPAHAADPACDAPSLSAVFQHDFRIGAALASSRTPEVEALVARHFNSVTPENILKWHKVHPAEDRYEFGPLDRLVEFAISKDMRMFGHTLIWYYSTPDWVFDDLNDTPRETVLARLRTHIETVMGHYRETILEWDVVNEALSDDPETYLREGPWRDKVGPDYVAKAFHLAHEANPVAKLYYNDYGLTNAPKRAKAIRLITELRADGAQVDGIGIQGHFDMVWPSVGELDETIKAFADMGLRISISELDVSLYPRDAGEHHGLVLRPEVLQRQADRYAEIFGVLLKHREHIDRVTFWGVHDGISWKNAHRPDGEFDHPLLFDRSLEEKPAFCAVVKTRQTFGQEP